jgi:hypothetical protein
MSAAVRGTGVALSFAVLAVGPEFLGAPTRNGLTRIEISVRVHRQSVKVCELAGHMTWVSSASERLATVTIYGPEQLFLAVGHKDQNLVTLWRERQVPGRPDVCGVTESMSAVDEDVPYERAVLLEDLNAVTFPVVHVHETVVPEVDRMNGSEELSANACLGFG